MLLLHAGAGAGTAVDSGWPAWRRGRDRGNGLSMERFGAVIVVDRRGTAAVADGARAQRKEDSCAITVGVSWAEDGLRD